MFDARVQGGLAVLLARHERLLVLRDALAQDDAVDALPVEWDVDLGPGVHANAGRAWITGSRSFSDARSDRGNPGVASCSGQPTRGGDVEHVAAAVAAGHGGAVACGDHGVHRVAGHGVARRLLVFVSGVLARIQRG